MTEPAPVEVLLTEIRDLLRIVAEGSFPAYQAEVVRQMGSKASELKQMVNTEAQWKALALLDGKTTLASVANATGSDPSNLRKFLSRVASAEFVIEGERGPECTLTALELRAIKEMP